MVEQHRNFADLFGMNPSPDFPTEQVEPLTQQLNSMLSQGDIKIGDWVAVDEGQGLLVASNPDRDILSKQIIDYPVGCWLHQVGLPLETFQAVPRHELGEDGGTNRPLPPRLVRVNKI